MKKIRIFIVLVLVLTFFCSVDSLFAKKKVPFGVGETIVFDIEVNGVLAGTQKMEVKKIEKVNGKKCYYCRAATRTLPAIEKKFNYKLNDVTHVWMDVNKIRPVRVKKDIQEGKWINKITLDFYYNIRRIFFVDEKKVPDGKYISFKSKVLDILSLVYYYRTVDLKVGKRYSVEYIGHDKPKIATFKVVRGPEIDDIPTIIVKQIGGDEARGITVTMTNDKNRIPIKVTVDFDVARFAHLQVVGTIKSYSPPK